MTKLEISTSTLIRCLLVALLLWKSVATYQRRQLEESRRQEQMRIKLPSLDSFTLAPLIPTGTLNGTGLNKFL